MTIVEEKLNKLIVIGGTPFPFGLASTNRLVTLLSELTAKGWDVDVLNFASTKFPTNFINSEGIFSRKGVFNGIKFHYTSLTVKSSKYRLLAIISTIYGLFALPFVVFFKIKLNPFSKRIILTNLTQVHYVLYLKILSYFFKTKFVLLRSEYPSVIQFKTKFTKPYKVFVEPWVFKLFDGFALMTKTLCRYFASLQKNKAITAIIPMTVDISRFSEKTSCPFNFEYIAYAGSLSSEKDGVDILLKAYLNIALDFPGIHLVIIGDTRNKHYSERLSKIILNSGAFVGDRVHFTGLIDSNLIPQYLINAKILALARPDSIQAQGGFPTKLGEYLATSNPVIVTKVGEIPDYLIHEVNAVLCEPGSIEDFTQKLDWMLRNPSIIKNIGVMGNKVSLEVFNSKVQGERLHAFLKSILRSIP